MFGMPVMSGIGDWVLQYMVIYGAPILLLLTFVGSLGIPFPVTLVVVAAGALTRYGLLDWRLALAACVVGGMLADHSEYIIGRMARQPLESRLGDKRIWQKALAVINKRGGWAIVLTRFWLTPLAPAVNLLAGSRVRYSRFLMFDLLGEVVWVVVYGGLGYIFVHEWRLVSEALGDFSGISVVLLALVVVAYLLVKRYRRRQYVSQ